MTPRSVFFLDLLPPSSAPAFVEGRELGETLHKMQIVAGEAQKRQQL